jgi:hypothetical protein
MGQALDLIVLDSAHPGNMNKGQLPSEWVALTANESLAQNLMRKGWHFSTLQSTPLWTDDYSNLIPLLRM